MKLEQILSMEYPEKFLIDDQTVIRVTKEFESTGSALRRRGNWFEDHILDLMDEEVSSFEMDLDTNTLAVYLK